MGGKRIISDSQIEEMAAMRERGWGIKRIAAHFTQAGTPVSSSSINWQCMRVGADAPPHLRGRHTVPSRTYSRNGSAVRPWTGEDDAELLRLEASGMSINRIGTMIGRASSSVRGRMLTLSRRDARREEAHG